MKNQQETQFKTENKFAGVCRIFCPECTIYNGALEEPQKKHTTLTFTHLILKGQFN